MTKNDTPQKKRVMPDQIRHPEINNMKTNLKVIISIIFIIFVFAFLRFSNIYSVPVFVDEAIYVRWSQVMRSEASLRFLPMSDGKQPLFMWASMPIFKLIFIRITAFSPEANLRSTCCSQNPVRSLWSWYYGWSFCLEFLVFSKHFSFTINRPTICSYTLYCFLRSHGFSRQHACYVWGLGLGLF